MDDRYRYFGRPCISVLEVSLKISNKLIQGCRNLQYLLRESEYNALPSKFTTNFCL